jgi:uncharacterized damage-inducible protein DinB
MRTSARKGLHVDILDRLLGHDEWTTRQVLLRCRELGAEQMRQPFDVGHSIVEETLLHIIGNIEVWTDLMCERPVRERPLPQGAHWTIEELSRRFGSAYAEFATFTRQIRDAGRLDATYTDVLDNPPTAKTYGGTIVHVITHNMTHRGELLHMLQRLGLADLPEGDALSWEAAMRCENLAGE